MSSQRLAMLPFLLVAALLSAVIFTPAHTPNLPPNHKSSTAAGRTLPPDTRHSTPRHQWVSLVPALLLLKNRSVPDNMYVSDRPDLPKTVDQHPDQHLHATDFRLSKDAAQMAGLLRLIRQVFSWKQPQAGENCRQPRHKRKTRMPTPEESLCARADSKPKPVLHSVTKYTAGHNTRRSLTCDNRTHVRTNTTQAQPITELTPQRSRPNVYWSSHDPLHLQHHLHVPHTKHSRYKQVIDTPKHSQDAGRGALFHPKRPTLQCPSTSADFTAMKKPVVAAEEKRSVQDILGLPFFILLFLICSCRRSKTQKKILSDALAKTFAVPGQLQQALKISGSDGQTKTDCGHDDSEQKREEEDRLCRHLSADVPQTESSTSRKKRLDLEKDTNAADSYRKLSIWSSFTSSFSRRFPVVPLTTFPASFLPSLGPSAVSHMSHLGYRLASLSALPASCSVSRVRLAEAGFYYDTSKTTREASDVHEVVCHSCGLTYGDWTTGDNPVTVHRNLRPDCQHMKSLIPENSRPGQSSSPPPHVGGSSLTPSEPSRAVFTHESPPTPSTSASNSGCNGTSTGSQYQGTLPGIGSAPATRSEPDRIPRDPGGTSLQRNTAPGDTHRGDLQTDCAAIVPPPQTSPSTVARPRYHSSSVPPISNSVGPAPSNQSRQLSARDGSMARGEELDDRPLLEIRDAVYPQFCRMQDRRVTFDTWPLTEYFHPDDLVMQGFYYAGYADCLRCFYCGVGLKSWAEDDVVMDEHIRWRPSCGYVLNTKGRRFVNSVLRRLQTSTGRLNDSCADPSGTTPAAGCSSPAPAPAPAPTSSSSALTVTPTTSPGSNPAVTSSPAQLSSGSPASGSTGTSTGSSTAAPPASTVSSTTGAGGNASGGSREVLRQVEEMGFTRDSIARAVRHLQQAGVATVGPDQLVNAIIELDLSDDSSASTTTTASASKNKSDSSTERQHGLQTDGPDHTESSNADSAHMQAMIAENERLRARGTCRTCRQAPVGLLFMPCGHLICCTRCGSQTRDCPNCGQRISATANVYLT